MKTYNARTLQEVTPSGQDLLTELFNKTGLRRIQELAKLYQTKNSWLDGLLCSTWDKAPEPEIDYKDNGFLWITAKGDFIYVSKMETNHLFNAFRMLFNHGIPAAFRVGYFNRRPEIYGWSREYKEQAFDAMRAELKKREDELSRSQKDELEDMGQNARTYALLRQDEDPKNPMVGEPYDVD